MFTAKKRKDMPWLTLGIAGANLAGQLYSSHQSSKANKSIQKDLSRQEAMYRGFYDRERYTGPLGSLQAQAALTQAREGLREGLKSSRGNAIRRGSTTEATVASQAGASNAYANALVGVMGQEDRRREMAKNRYMSMLRGATGSRMNFQMQDAQKWGTAMDNVAKFGATAADVYGEWKANK